jgi:hypothetical protein
MEESIFNSRRAACISPWGGGWMRFEIGFFNRNVGNSGIIYDVGKIRVENCGSKHFLGRRDGILNVERERRFASLPY